jgi:hypothetical protein
MGPREYRVLLRFLEEVGWVRFDIAWVTWNWRAFYGSN